MDNKKSLYGLRLALSGIIAFIYLGIILLITLFGESLSFSNLWPSLLLIPWFPYLIFNKEIWSTNPEILKDFPGMIKKLNEDNSRNFYLVLLGMFAYATVYIIWLNLNSNFTIQNTQEHLFFMIGIGFVNIFLLAPTSYLSKSEGSSINFTSLLISLPFFIIGIIIYFVHEYSLLFLAIFFLTMGILGVLKVFWVTAHLNKQKV